MRAVRFFPAIALCGALAACGENLAEQSVIGAGMGAATAAVLDTNVLAGAAVGAAANVLVCKNTPQGCS
jgi:malic enzyme